MTMVLEILIVLLIAVIFSIGISVYKKKNKNSVESLKRALFLKSLIYPILLIMFLIIGFINFANLAKPNNIYDEVRSTDVMVSDSRVKNRDFDIKEAEDLPDNSLEMKCNRERAGLIKYESNYCEQFEAINKI